MVTKCMQSEYPSHRSLSVICHGGLSPPYYRLSGCIGLHPRCARLTRLTCFDVCSTGLARFLRDTVFVVGSRARCQPPCVRCAVLTLLEGF